MYDTLRHTLLDLREHLSSTSAYPWNDLRAWVARAHPLFQNRIPAHLKDFDTHTKEPPWDDNPYEVGTLKARIVAGGNEGRADRAKQNILSWLDGVIDYLPADAPMESSAENWALSLLDRVPAAIRTLARRHRKRPALQIQDEYDLQYILHAILSAGFQDVRPEEWTPSYAGNASRMDFLLKQHRIVIETKHTRDGLEDRAVADELIIDRSRYSAHPDCGTLICFVYDPTHRLRNPEALEHDLAQNSNPRVRIIVRPK